MAGRRFTLEIKELHKGQEHPEVAKVQRYLTRFGYLAATVEPGRLDAATSDALRLFQHIGGLEETGELDPPTVDALVQPRCGVPDSPTVEASRQGLAAAFVLSGCSYGKRTFTYRFVNGTGDIAGSDEQAAVQRAFTTWASVVTGMSFRQTKATNADFVIGWFSGGHGDGQPFDGVGSAGAGNVLAHAFYPPPCNEEPNAGAMHFDEVERWSLNGTGGTTDLESVALHEIGHLLGLRHSTVRDAVMSEFYVGVRRTLSQDDILGIRRLYPALYRRGDSASQAGVVDEIATARLVASRLVTAVRSQDGRLKLIAWRLNANGSATRTGDSGNQAGTATSIGIARAPTGNRVVTACRTDEGTLRLITWDINAAGTSIQRRGDSGSQAGTASLIRVVPLGITMQVTACQTAEGTLKLIAWSLQPDGSLTRLADSGNQAGAVSELDMTAVGADRVLTAVRTSDGNLRLILWRVTPSSVQRLGDSGNQAGSSRLIRVVIDPSGNAVTAVKTADDKLKLISWRIQPSGALQRLGDSGNLGGVTNGHDLGLAPEGRW